MYSKKQVRFCDTKSPSDFHYEKLKVLGRGSYGVVSKARNKITQKTVALKRLLDYDEDDGLPEYAFQEIIMLRRLKHENVVIFYNFCVNKREFPRPAFYLVLELCQIDLEAVLTSSYSLSPGHIKNILKQILKGLCYIHDNNIMHLDIKPGNILITKAGVVKLTDFGMAQEINEGKDQPNNKVGTLAYQPPEIILGKKNFGPAVDMCGVGCIMGEFWTRTSTLLPGNHKQDQLNLISRLCGSFNSKDWPDLENLNKDNEFTYEKGHRRKVKEWFADESSDTKDLIDRLLILNPSKRIDSRTALNHVFFHMDPLTTNLGNLFVNDGKLFEPTCKGIFHRLYSSCPEFNFYFLIPLLIVYLYLVIFILTYCNFLVPSIK